MRTFPLVRMMVPSLVLLVSGFGYRPQAPKPLPPRRPARTAPRRARPAAVPVAAMAAYRRRARREARGPPRPRRHAAAVVECSAERYHVETDRAGHDRCHVLCVGQVDNRQHGSHRRHGEMQGRHLFEGQKPHRRVLQARRRRSVAGRLQVTGSFNSGIRAGQTFSTSRGWPASFG